ncbi:hypothetical protein DVR12_08620 [Chitinophaga silvatica]|uniref:Uncharacterized protein n=1 Tax=Chitinophaga silvatica TaxID=2282649 RepID=A0A3E1YCF5_9BACT|nr:hypothetical protein DVR12_08620 [Chitinophaga silvatica]
MDKKEKINMEVFDLAVKQAVEHAEIRVRLELSEKVEFYKRLCKFLILLISLVTVCSIVLNIRMLIDCC